MFLRVAIRVNGVLTYLHTDHLGSTVLETNASGAIINDEKYRAFGKQRDTGIVGTDYQFTGQKQDASGLQYFNSRFFDPLTGMFVSPDTMVPDAGNVFDYNRFMYARGNAMKYTDPSGHCVTTALGVAANVGTGGAAAVLTGVEIGIDAACWAAVTEAVYLVSNMVMMWGAEAPAIDDRVAYMADQVSNNGSADGGNSGNLDPNDFDKIGKAFRDKFGSIQGADSVLSELDKGGQLAKGASWQARHALQFLDPNNVIGFEQSGTKGIVDIMMKQGDQLAFIEAKHVNGMQLVK
ncbi:MAG: RHS repeat-associated core domain-containing protein [Caldilineaceae bacterium]